MYCAVHRLVTAASCCVYGGVLQLPSVSRYSVAFQGSCSDSNSLEEAIQHENVQNFSHQLLSSYIAKQVASSVLAYFSRVSSS